MNLLMQFRSHCKPAQRLLSAAFMITALLASPDRVQAGHVLNTGSGFQSSPLYVTFTGVNGGNPFFTSAGSIGLSPHASIDNASLPFMYCVELFTDIYVPGSYTATLSSTGIIHGGLIANAGEIAWLIDNVAPSATSTAAQEGLQAAIWKQIYGSSFNVAPTSAGTDSGIFADYTADITALGSNTAPVSDVLWISPYNSDGSPAQGQVTAGSVPHTVSSGDSVPTPEPATLVSALVATVLGLGYWARARRLDA